VTDEQYTEAMNRAASRIGVALIITFSLNLPEAEALADKFEVASQNTLEANEAALAAEAS